MCVFFVLFFHLFVNVNYIALPKVPIRVQPAAQEHHPKKKPVKLALVIEFLFSSLYFKFPTNEMLWIQYKIKRNGSEFFFLLINQSSSDIKFLIELNFKNVYTLVIYHSLWKIDTSNAMEKSVGWHRQANT